MTDPDPPKPGLLRIHVEHTPSPNDPKGADELYKAIGLLIVAWGRLEGHFVTCLLMLLAASEGRLGEQLPMNWKERAAVWRKAFETIAPLQPFKEAAFKLLIEIEDAAQERHVVAHALWERFRPEDSLAIDAVLIKAKAKSKNGLDIRRFPVKLGALKKVRERINKLNIALLPLSTFLTRYRSSLKPPPEDIRII
jgi:hypothetical protein